MLVYRILWCAFVALTFFELSRSQNCVSGPPHYLCPKDANFLEVYLPHETYCNRFYKCIQGQAVESRCQSGNFFNPVMNLCCPNDAFCVRPEPVVKQFPQCISCGQQFIYCDGRPLPRFYVCNCDGNAVEQYCPWALNMCSGKNITLVFTNGRCQADQSDLMPIPIKIQVVQEVVATADAFAFAAAGVQSGGPPPPPPSGVGPSEGSGGGPSEGSGGGPSDTTTEEETTTEQETTTEEAAPQRKREASKDILEFEAPAIEADLVEIGVPNNPTPTTIDEITSTMEPPVPKPLKSSSDVLPSNSEALTSPDTQAQSQTLDAFLLVPGMSLIPSNQQLVWQVDNVPFVLTT